LSVRLVEDAGKRTLHLETDAPIPNPKTTLVTSDLLGQARVPDLPYVNADGSPVRVDVDYFGKRRDSVRPTPGPFEEVGAGSIVLRVW
jgi:alpha-N-arabinofuranosidase